MDQVTIALSIFIVIMTFACGFVYFNKQSPQTKVSQEVPTNWNWNDVWTPSQQVPNLPGPNDPKPIPLEGITVKPQMMADSYKNAISMSNQFGKPVLFFFSASWCNACQRMKNETLNNASVSELMKNYIYVVIDTDKDRETTAKFGLKSIPAFVIVNGAETKLKSVESFMSVSVFSTWLNDPNIFNQPRSQTTPIPPESLPQKPQQKPLLRRS